MARLAACVAALVAALVAASAASVPRRRLMRASAMPRPTPQQLAWQEGEIMALVHFNMATFFQNGDPGCTAANWNEPNGGSSNPENFAPTNLNISQWVESMKALGVREAVMTAKHGCGFFLWPTNVTLPNGTRYPYRVNDAKYGDVVGEFAKTMQANGLGHGYYFSLTNNFFLGIEGHQVMPGPRLPGQQNVTLQQFEDISTYALTELWSQYGNFTEIWFDGGFFDMAARLQPILFQYQPQAVCFNGAGLSLNPARWCGTEGDLPPGWPTIWSTDCPGARFPGCPGNTSGAFWNPSGLDYTLQVGDTWFFEPGVPVRPLSELITVYQNTVGSNVMMELDFAIDRTGRVAPQHAVQYAAFGNWIRSCYGQPVANMSGAANATVLVLPLSSSAPVAIDRVMIREDQGNFGQAVAGYTVEFQASSGSAWSPFSSGVTVGNKRIDVLSSGPVTAVAVRLTLTDVLDVPRISTFAAFAPGPCALPQDRVKFQYGSGPSALCLSSNATFPCPGGADNSCPLFLGDCSSPMAVWNDMDGVLTSAGVPSASPQVNIDCDNDTSGSVAKLIVSGGSMIVFQSGQLVYTPPGGADMCLNNGSDPVSVPCNPSEPYLEDQITIQDCGKASTQGWQRIVVG